MSTGRDNIDDLLSGKNRHSLFFDIDKKNKLAAYLDSLPKFELTTTAKVGFGITGVTGAIATTAAIIAAVEIFTTTSLLTTAAVGTAAALGMTAGVVMGVGIAVLAVAAVAGAICLGKGLYDSRQKRNKQIKDARETVESGTYIPQPKDGPIYNGL